MDNNNLYNNSNNISNDNVVETASTNVNPVGANTNTGFYNNYQYKNTFATNVTFNHVPKEDHAFLKTMKENYMFYLIASLIYGVLFSFGIFENFSGITSPLFAIGSAIYILVCSKKANIKVIKKSTIVLSVAIFALGINLCCTKDGIILFMDYIFIFILNLILGITIFYNDSLWGLGKYIEAILCSSFGALEHIFTIISDGIHYSANQKNSGQKSKNASLVLAGIAITIPILLVVLGLLSSADKFFGDFVNTYIWEPFSSTSIEKIGAIIYFIAGTMGSYMFMRWLCTHRFYEEVKESKKSSAIIAITVSSILNLVYIIFSGFQIFYLFLGDMTLPADYTYAEYAREGFFQLVVVCLINMVLVLSFISIFEESKLLKAMLTVTSACTFIMIASSLMRMILYINMYQLTYTRVFVLWSLAIIFLGMVGTVIYIFKNNFPILKYFVTVTVLIYCMFAYSKPAYVIAKNNLSTKFCNAAATDNNDKYRDIDFDYFKDHYSIDALPAINVAIIRENNPYFTSKLYDQTELRINQSDDYVIDPSSYKSYSACLYHTKQFNFAENAAFKSCKTVAPYREIVQKGTEY